MPNWCFNSVSVEGSEADIQEFDAHFKRPHESYSGGTSHLVKSELGPDDVKKMLEEHHTFRIKVENGKINVHYIDKVTEESGYSFTNIVPLTKEAYLEGWYDWSIENWGTKWDASDMQTDLAPAKDGSATAYYSFDTAWGPAEPVVKEMSRQFPNLRFVHTYDESGMGYAGIITYEHGAEVNRTEADGNDYNRYLQFKRDEFGNDDIGTCKACNKLYDVFNVDEDEDGNEICPNCEAPISEAVTA